MGKCVIIAAGQCDKIDYIKSQGDFVICADGGLKYAQKFGIEPDLIVGDFDSYGKVPNGKEVVALPCEKDKTDTHYAIDCGFERGYNTFLLYGMLGGRVDHLFANLQLLSYVLNKGGTAVIVGDSFDITAIKNGGLCIKGEKGKYVSVFSFGEKSKGVTIKGLKYEVFNVAFSNDNPLGVSNEFGYEDAFVEVKDGILIIMCEKGKKKIFFENFSKKA